MKGLKALLVPALATAVGLALVTDVEAQRSGGGARAGGGTRGAAAGGYHGGGPGGGWHGGGHGGGWHGGHGGHGGHYHGGHGGYWYGYGWWGVPLLWGAAYYGWPYYYCYGYPYYGYPYYDNYYPRAYPAPYPAPASPSAEMGPPAEVTPGPGAPTQGPLYMNYCESSKAYYPKVTTCPEGWKFLRPNA